MINAELKNTLMTVCTVFLLGTTYAQSVGIGRATITLPADGEWVEVREDNTSTSYGGDAPGTTTAESKTYALLDTDKTWLALLSVRASKSSVSNATMSWTGGCKAVGNQAVYDFTHGSPVRNDCLRVHRSVNADTFLSIANNKALKEQLLLKGIQVSGSSYLVSHFIGTQSGTFVFTQALISHKALKQTAGANLGEEFSGQPGVAWGHLLAAESRSSANSIRGRMSIPSLK